MGSEQSNTTGKPQKYSQAEVDRKLENQRKAIEKKYQQQAEEDARLAARQRVENLLLLRKNEAASSAAPPPSFDTSTERKPSPYSFTQNELHIVAQPTVTNLHPSSSERNNAASSASNNNQTNAQTFGISNLNSTETQSNNEMYSQADVDRILQNQKSEIEKHISLAEQAASSEQKPPPYSSIQNSVTVAQPAAINQLPKQYPASKCERSYVASIATNNYQTNPQTFGDANSNLNYTEAESLERNPLPYSIMQNSPHTAAQPAVTKKPQKYRHNTKIYNARSPSPLECNNAASIASNKNQTNLQKFGDANSDLNYTEAVSLERNPPPYSFIQNSPHTAAQPAVTKKAPKYYHQTKIYNARSPSPLEQNNAASIASNENQTNPQTFGDANSNLKSNKAQRPPARQARHRSASRRRNQYEQAETALVDPCEDDQLNCSTCNNKYTRNIYQCPSGHSSCSLCRGRLALCGACGYPVGNMRNMPLEAYIAETKTRCPNAQDGCRLLIKMADLEEHAKECPFQVLACPLADLFGLCRWHGKLSQILKHFEDIHPIHLYGHVDTEMTAMTSESQIVHLVMMGSFHFLFHMKVSERESKLYMTVQLIGTKHSAAKWSYEIHVYNKSEPRRKYQYNDICHSASTSLEQIFLDESCATLPLNYVYTFLNNERLNYKFYIKRNVESGSAKYPSRWR